MDEGIVHYLNSEENSWWNLVISSSYSSSSSSTSHSSSSSSYSSYSSSSSSYSSSSSPPSPPEEAHTPRALLGSSRHDALRSTGVSSWASAPRRCTRPGRVPASSTCRDFPCSCPPRWDRSEFWSVSAPGGLAKQLSLLPLLLTPGRHLLPHEGAELVHFAGSGSSSPGGRHLLWSSLCPRSASACPCRSPLCLPKWQWTVGWPWPAGAGWGSGWEQGRWWWLVAS